MPLPSLHFYPKNILKMSKQGAFFKFFIWRRGTQKKIKCQHIQHIVKKQCFSISVASHKFQCRQVKLNHSWTDISFSLIFCLLSFFSFHWKLQTIIVCEKCRNFSLDNEQKFIQIMWKFVVYWEGLGRWEGKN